MKKRVDLVRSPGLVIMHLPCLLVFWAGVSRAALIACALLYLARGFGITGGYHRYFAHRSYKTGRVFQFLLACLGASAVQQGPLWWAAHHRNHHKNSDTADDVHSPVSQGFWYAHMGWIAAPENHPTDYKTVHDLARYPELRFINKYHVLPPLALAVGLWWAGSLLQSRWPELGTSGFQMLVWGFFVNTVLLYHGTFAINSLTHLFGRRRFPTPDNSRNSFLIALFTLGEGWHNNHHRFPASERQGLYWWEIDVTHYFVKALSWAGLVWDVQTQPRHAYARDERVRAAARTDGAGAP